MEHIKDIQKKTQGIVTALYMVSDCMDEKEPIKIEFRMLGVGLIKNILSLQITDKGEYYKKVTIVRYHIAEVQSLLALGRTVGIVSVMNAHLLDTELIGLSHSLAHVHPPENLKSKSFILPETFFKEEFKKETVLTQHQQTQLETQKNTQGVSLGTASFETFSFEKNNQNNVPQNTLASRVDAPIKTEIKDNRRKEIMDTIKRQGTVSGVSIKDITKIFTEVSEKTIQREITDMLLKGQIKKTGDKRWSRYYPI